MHRVVGLGILYFVFASIEGVLRITGVSSAPSLRFLLLQVVKLTVPFCIFMGPKKGSRQRPCPHYRDSSGCI